MKHSRKHKHKRRHKRHNKTVKRHRHREILLPTTTPLQVRKVSNKIAHQFVPGSYSPTINQQLVTLVTTTLTLIVVKNRSLDFFPKKLVFGLVWLGNRSYSIYLVHLPIIYLLMNSPHFHSIVPKGEVLKFCLLIFLSFLVGHMAYTKIEMRYRESHDHTNTKTDLLKIFICFISP